MDLFQGTNEKDICQIALVERHQGTGGVVNAFVSGFGYTGNMAMASTVAHDSHHMIVVGTDPHADMALAANRLAETSGAASPCGKTAQEQALVELPIAGLMSDSPRATEVAAKAEAMGKPRWKTVAALLTMPICSILCWRWLSYPSYEFLIWVLSTFGHLKMTPLFKKEK